MKIAAIIPKMPKRWDDLDAAVVILAGCNFACPHCLVPELVKDADAIERIPISRAFEILFSQIDTSRVVITGGEPLVQGQKLVEFLETIKNGGFKVKLETNGSHPLVLEELIREELIDFVTIDIKQRLIDSAYQEFTSEKGTALAVKQSIRLLRKSGLPFEFSFTVVPWLHAKDDVFQAAYSLRGNQRLVLQSFVPTTHLMAEEFQNCPTPSLEMMESLAHSLLPYFPEIKVIHPQRKWNVSFEQPALLE